MTQHATTATSSNSEKAAELQTLREQLLRLIVKNETSRKSDVSKTG